MAKQWNASLGVVVVLAIMPLTVHGDFAKQADWNPSKRKLCYRLDKEVKDDPLWSEWIAKAIRLWNDVKDKTGWEFVECSVEERNPDITFKFGECKCGAKTDPILQNSALGNLKVTIQKDISGLKINGKEVSGGVDKTGWRLEGATTLDPVLVIAHELTHAMRLDHGRQGKSDTGNLEEPISPGNHNNPKDRKPSKSDIDEAKKAADAK